MYNKEGRMREIVREPGEWRNWITIIMNDSGETESVSRPSRTFHKMWEVWRASSRLDDGK